MDRTPRLISIFRCSPSDSTANTPRERQPLTCTATCFRCSLRAFSSSSTPPASPICSAVLSLRSSCHTTWVRRSTTPGMAWNFSNAAVTAWYTPTWNSSGSDGPAQSAGGMSSRRQSSLRPSSTNPAEAAVGALDFKYAINCDRMPSKDSEVQST